MTIQQIIDGILGQVGVLFLLLFILYAGYKRWWVFGWYAKEIAQRNERLENRMDRVLGTSQTATDLANVATTKLVEGSKAEVSSE